MDYCRCCKRYVIQNNRRNNKYCGACGVRNRDKRVNKYLNSENFIYESFEDCIDSESWGGFRNIKYSTNIRESILKKFPKIKFYKTGKIESRQKNEGILLYTLFTERYELLKVGQTTNTKTRFSKYNSEYYYDLFICRSWESQDLHEKKLRNYLEFIGFKLPMDAEDKRLDYINYLQ